VEGLKWRPSASLQRMPETHRDRQTKEKNKRKKGGSQKITTQRKKRQAEKGGGARAPKSGFVGTRGMSAVVDEGGTQ